MSPSPLFRVRTAARYRAKSERDFRAAIVAASDAGHSLRDIGKAAGLSHVRVLRIVREAGERDGQD